MKRWFCLLMVVVMVALMATSGAGAEEIKNSHSQEVSMEVQINGQSMVSERFTYTVNPGDEITVTATTTNGSDIFMIGYYFCEDGFDTFVDNRGVSSVTIVIPEEEEGTKKTLAMEAVSAANQGQSDLTNRTDWQYFYLKWGNDPTEEDCFRDGCQVALQLTWQGEEMQQGWLYSVEGGQEINVNAMSKDASIAFVSYYFIEKQATESEHEHAFRNRTKVFRDSFYIVVPEGEPGTQKYLMIEAVDATDDGTPNEVTKTGWMEYDLRYPDRLDETVGEVTVSYRDELVGDETINVVPGSSLVISSTSEENMDRIFFQWDEGELMEVSAFFPYHLTISEAYEAGTHHSLEVIALYDNGNYSEWKKVEFTISSEEQ